jgi:hypothetical protein
MRPGWFIAEFDGPCDWGDWVEPGDTVRLVEETGGFELPTGWEHKECREAERAVFVRPRATTEGKSA